MDISIKNFPSYIFLSLLIGVGLIPNWGALDRIATQWLYLSILNSFFLVYFFFDSNKKTDYSKIIIYKPLISLSLFVIWGLISFFYSINGTEVIVKFIRWIQIPISLFLIMIISNDKEIKFLNVISFIVTFVLLVELYFTYSTYFDITSLTKYNFSFAYLLRGATGNKNINAASILIKIPFVYFLLSYYKRIIIKLFFAFIIIFSTYLVLIISARAALISLLLIIILLTLIILYYILKRPKSKNLISLFLFLGSMVFAFSVFQIEYRDDNSASITDRVSTVNFEDESVSQRIRFYYHSINQLINNPLIGVGLGNWKIKSIDYDKYNIEGYIVPYHVHNDFLEFGAELGVIGLGLYIYIFIYLFNISLKSLLNSLLNFKDNLGIELLILLSGIVYLIDANLNFPHARPVMQIPLILLISISFKYFHKKES